ncbi:MAG: hypothetical protein WCF57_14050 [Pyrinomonadaceae bacterium]
MKDNPFVGTWNYRSFYNNPDDITDWNNLQFGAGTLKIAAPSSDTLGGTIGGSLGPGQGNWLLNLHGSISYGTPGQVRFQGRGLVSGEEWVYDYIGWLVPVWPNSNATLQRAAIVGSIVRTIPHSGSDGTVHPAGVVASFYAVRMD